VRHAYDTNVWHYAQTDAAFARALNATVLRPLGLSAVVAGELIRRAHTALALHLAEEICRRLRHAVLVPTWSDWIAAAEALRRVRERHHFDAIGLARLQNDALIAVSCAREGWTIVTADRTDFPRLVDALGSRAPRVRYLDAPGPGEP
jgi:predicted nucleic acid-binding protein